MTGHGLKVRIGIGASAVTPESLDSILAGITEFGFDSIWCAEVLSAPGLDPFVALAFAAARYPRLKVGTTMLLPGRNLIRLAKQLAALDTLSRGRLLVTFVPGINRGPEAGAIGLPVAQRRAAIEESLPVLRELLTGEPVSHTGPVAEFTDVVISPAQWQQPLEFWLGGMVPRSLEMCGRLGDGWLPSFCTPESAAAGKAVIDRAAADVGRRLDPEHFGVSIGYADRPLEAGERERLASRAGAADLDRLVPVGPTALRTLLEEFIQAGFSKFVLRPFAPPSDWSTELSALADTVLDLQT